jgi:hypothetical protein
MLTVPDIEESEVKKEEEEEEEEEEEQEEQEEEEQNKEASIPVFFRKKVFLEIMTFLRHYFSE